MYSSAVSFVTNWINLNWQINVTLKNLFLWILKTICFLCHTKYRKLDRTNKRFTFKMLPLQVGLVLLYPFAICWNQFDFITFCGTANKMVLVFRYCMYKLLIIKCWFPSDRILICKCESRSATAHTETDNVPLQIIINMKTVIICILHIAWF